MPGSGAWPASCPACGLPGGGAHGRGSAGGLVLPSHWPVLRQTAVRAPCSGPWASPLQSHPPQTRGTAPALHAPPTPSICSARGVAGLLRAQGPLGHFGRRPASHEHRTQLLPFLAPKRKREGEQELPTDISLVAQRCKGCFAAFSFLTPMPFLVTLQDSGSGLPPSMASRRSNLRKSPGFSPREQHVG